MPLLVRLGIRGKLAVVVALIMLCGLIVIGFRYQDSKNMLEKELTARVEAEMVWWAHRLLIHQIDDVKDLAVALAGFPETQKAFSGTPKNEFVQAAKDLLRPYPVVDMAVLAGADGTEVVRLSRKGNGEYLIVPASEDWQRNPFFKEGLSLKPGLAASTSVGLIKSEKEKGGEPFLCVVSPVSGQHTAAGAVILETKLDTILEKFRPPVEHTTVYFTDEKGDVLYSTIQKSSYTQENRFDKDSPEELGPGLVRLIKASEKGVLTDKHHLYGFSRVYFDQPNSARYFIMVYDIPVKVLFSGARRVGNVFLLTGLLVFLVSLVAVSIIATNVARPVLRLAKVADSVAKGDLSQDAGPMARRDEIGWLYRSFDEMIKALRESKNREEEKKAHLLEAAGKAAVEMTSDLSVPAILGKLVRSVLMVVNAECACLHLSPMESEEGFFTAGKGNQKCGILERMNGGGIAQEIFKKGQVVRVTREEIDAGAYKPVVEGINAIFGVPIFSEGHVIGALCIGTRHKEISEADEAAIKLLTAHTGVAVANTWLHEEVVALAKDLERRVEERTKELREANIELERANRLKSEFLATMSHELRTPLNTIIGFSDVLLSDLVPGIPENTKEYLKDILESGEHLLSLINDVLDLAKIEAGKDELHLEEVRVPDFIRGVLVLFRERAANHKITVEINTHGVGEWFLDTRKFKQILFNLLSNAFKFTPDGGKVGIKAQVENNTLAVTVWDTGIGIHPEDMPRLFRPFGQLDSSLARRYPGTGLGLTMVKRLVEQHGGTVHVESEPGKGASFTVYFPSSMPEGTDSSSMH